MTHDTTLATVYEGWEAYHNHLVRAVAPLSDEELALRAAPHLRPIRVLVAHVIAARVYWLHHILGEGSADLATMMEWDDEGQPNRTAEELVAGLEESWRLIHDSLGRWSPSGMEQTFVRRSRRGEEQVSRQWVIWHLIEHDLHHGGELSFALGMHGLDAIDL